MGFLRLFDSNGYWYDNKEYPCKNNEKYDVAKQLLHDKTDAFGCFFFKDNGTWYEHSIDRVNVNEPLPNNKEWVKWARMFYPSFVF